LYGFGFLIDESWNYQFRGDPAINDVRDGTRISEAPLARLDVKSVST